MDEAKGDQIATERDNPPSKSLANLKPWKPGQSGNGKGRPKIEPRVWRNSHRTRRCRRVSAGGLRWI
jgi:hypothetical protein